jgi:polysaccharide deacetylase family protein (PEP-CTERM system associated)
MSKVTAPLAVASQRQAEEVVPKEPARIILSFDIEEHHLIEAAAGLRITAALERHYVARVEPTTRWLLDHLAECHIRATFFIVGQTAQNNPGLVRAIHRAGHEVASHSWDHQRLHNLTPATFREDVRRSKDVLEQLTGQAVVGYRAPTFSIVRRTAWALDVLAELGMLYDSSVYPVRHDRYGVPQAPRAPFRARGMNESILEIPPATLRVLDMNMPVGGGGYFRLLPLFLFERALGQVQVECEPSVAMLYFHPWEFDPRQTRLPLGYVSRFRTYVGIYRARTRLAVLLTRWPKRSFSRAIDVAHQLNGASLPTFRLA